jgi:hypothetical protein
MELNDADYTLDGIELIESTDSSWVLYHKLYLMCLYDAC